MPGWIAELDLSLVTLVRPPAAPGVNSGMREHQQQDCHCEEYQSGGMTCGRQRWSVLGVAEKPTVECCCLTQDEAACGAGCWWSAAREEDRLLVLVEKDEVCGTLMDFTGQESLSTCGLAGGGGRPPVGEEQSSTRHRRS
jgi:hypothetical protein